MFEQIYLGNSLQTWLLSFLIAGASAFIGRLIYWIIQKTLKRYTKKTSSDLDFLLVDMVEEPISLAIAILGFWYAASLLVMPEGVRKFIDSTFYFLVIFNVAWFATRIIDALIEKYVVHKVEESETDLDDILLPIVRRIINISIWAITIIIGIDNAGYNVTTMITGLGIGGLVFALAAQDAVSNLFGGVIIFSDKPFNINERIVLNGFEGFVREIGLRSTKIETLDGRIVTIPNSKVTDNAVLNVSREKGRKVKFFLGLTYDTSADDIEKAKSILMDILESNDDIFSPVVAFDSFGDFSLNIIVIYWIKRESPIIGVQDSVNLEILRRFNKEKLDFAFPTQSIILEKSA